ncbi:MAG: hypothetical protein E3K36_15640 [Candidatus Brocadia sp.]|nr:hypothetical protein [Candidatus Brocadia sp.]
MAGTAAGCIIFDSVGFRASMYFDGFTYLFSAATIWKLVFGIMTFSLVESYTVASYIIFFIGIAGGAFLTPHQCGYPEDHS